MEVTVYTQKIRKIGNSEGVILPKAFLKSIGLHVGQKVAIKIEEEQICLRPVRPQYTLESLVSEMNEENAHLEITTGDSVGDEIVNYQEAKHDTTKSK